MVGKVLAGRYEVLERIGTGGMSLVYRARDLTLSRIVAVKILKQQWTEDADVIRRFHQEARAAASLTNLHVVQVFDVGREEPDIHYIVMELIKGRTLRETLDTTPVLAVREAIAIAEQVADGLDAAHRQKLVHRDIKPQNILMAEDKTVKVTDFGIAYAAASGTLVNTSSFLGTVQYLSPEQARGKLVGPQSDIYSLGVVLFEMLTGRLPFNGESAIGVALKHLQDQAPDVRSIRPTIPESVSRVVARALAKDPADRYQTASAFRADLLRILDPEAAIDEAPSSALPVPVPSADGQLPSRSKAREEQRRRPRRIWLWLSAVLLVVGGGGALAFYHWLYAPPVAVPNVRGIRLPLAKRKLRQKGLVAHMAGTSPSDRWAKGYVVRETPEPGSMVKAGQAVELVTSSGPIQLRLPNYSGQPMAVAEQGLRAERLRHKVVMVSSARPPGVVLRQRPQPHQLIAHGKVVTLWVSNGARAHQVMPYLVGMTVSQAATVLARDNLSEGTPVASYSTQPINTIIDQSPKPYQPVHGISQVSVWVSDGPSPESRHLPKNKNTPRFTIPQNASPHSLFEAVVEDQAGNKEMFYQQVNPGMRVRVPVVWYGTSAEVLPYLNNHPQTPLMLSAPPTGAFPGPGVGTNNTLGNQFLNAPS